MTRIAVKAEPSPITILLVDDDSQCRAMIRRAIGQGHLGNDVRDVASGAEALDLLYRRGPYADAPRPGLIYLDAEMPGISGLDVLGTIKADPDLKDIPVIVMIAPDDDRRRQEATRNGASACSVKPASPVAFFETVLAGTDYCLRIDHDVGHF